MREYKELTQEEVQACGYNSEGSLEKFRAANRWGIGWAELREQVRELARDEMKTMLRNALSHCKNPDTCVGCCYPLRRMLNELDNREGGP